MSDAIVMDAPNAYWGRKSGTYLNTKPKNHATVWGFVFKIKRGSATGASNNGGPAGHRLRWYQARAWSKAGKPLRNPEHQKKKN